MSKAPFHDLHHGKAEVKHIRLISEGGSLAKSPEPVCIDSIQVTQSCTTESQHIIYPTSPGSTPPPSQLFTLPSRHAAELDQASIPQLLRHRFHQRGIPLSEKARIQVRQAGTGWSISDQEREYLVKKLPAHLSVYESA